MDKEPKNNSNLSVRNFFSFLLKKAFSHKSTVLIIILAIIYSTVFSLACPLLYKVLFDNVIPNKNTDLLLIIACTLLGGLLILMLTQTTKSWLNSRLGVSITNAIREKMLAFPNSKLLDNNFKKSEFLKSFNADMAILEYYICHEAFNIIGSILTALLGLILLFVLNWALALLVIVVMATVGPISARISNKVDPANEIKTQQENILNLSADESVDLNETNFSLNLKQYWHKHNKSQLQKLTMPARRFHFLSDATSFVPGLLIDTVIISLLVGGAALALLGHFTVGELIAFLTLFANVAGSFGNAVESIPLITQARLALSNIYPYLKDKDKDENEKKRQEFSSHILIKNVNFSYDQKTKHLNNVNLEIKQGQWVAFVGGSGSGKSTLMKLILQFIKPDQGQVLFDGVNLSNINTQSHFYDARVVFQEPKLYTMSIKENILLSNPDATMEEIIAACKKAQVHENIMNTPNQYDTIVGKEGSSGLSGGQLQRITIARALISDPQIIYLDEATSALDPKSVSKILEMIENSRGKHTFIHVCHDLRKIKSCDQIVVMDKGAIIEVGNHNTLLTMQGKYKALWDIQQGVNIGDDEHAFEINEETLKRIPLLKNLGSEFLEKIGKEFDIHHAKQGEKIIEEGTKGQYFSIIASGKVSILKKFDDKEKHLATLEIGDFFGEISLIKSTATTATVKAKEYCVLLRLSRAKFQTFMQSLPQSQVKVIHDAMEKRLNEQHE